MDSYYCESVQARPGTGHGSPAGQHLPSCNDDYRRDGQSHGLVSHAAFAANSGIRIPYYVTVAYHQAKALYQTHRHCRHSIVTCFGACAGRQRTIKGAYEQLQRCFPQRADIQTAVHDLYVYPKQQKQDILKVLYKVRDHLGIPN